MLAGQEAGQVAGLDRGHPGFGRRQHAGGPLIGRERGPGRLGAPGRSDGPVELSRRGGRRLEHDLGGTGRIGHRIGAVAARFDLATDHESDRGRDVLDVCGHAHPRAGEVP